MRSDPSSSLFGYRSEITEIVEGDYYIIMTMWKCTVFTVLARTQASNAIYVCFYLTGLWAFPQLRSSALVRGWHSTRNAVVEHQPGLSSR